MRSNIFRHNSDSLRCAKHFRGSGFFGAALSVVSVGIEDEYGSVFAADLDRLAGVGALVEAVETRFRIVVGDPLADGLPRRFDGLEGVDVEGRKWQSPCPFMLHPLETSTVIVYSQTHLNCRTRIPCFFSGFFDVGSAG
jgi:hypothetical protein